MKNAISDMKNTVEGIKSRLDEAEDQISNSEDKIGKNIQQKQQKEKALKKSGKFKGALGPQKTTICTS